MIFEKIKELAEDYLPGEEITMDFNFRDSNLDSIDFVDIIMSLEDEYGIEMPGEMDEINTVADLVKLVQDLIDQN